MIEEFMLYHLLSDEEILSFYEKLFWGMNREDFLLLYLCSDRTKECIEVIRKERCDNQGNELWYPLMREYFVNSPYGAEHGCKRWRKFCRYCNSSCTPKYYAVVELFSKVLYNGFAKNGKRG